MILVMIQNARVHKARGLKPTYLDLAMQFLFGFFIYDRF